MIGMGVEMSMWHPKAMAMAKGVPKDMGNAGIAESGAIRVENAHTSMIQARQRAP